MKSADVVAGNAKGRGSLSAGLSVDPLPQPSGFLDEKRDVLANE